MTDTSVQDPGAPQPAPPTPPPARPTRPGASDGFFAWTAGLGVVRGDGWIGGVAAGAAARLRIDPLIVRGILVVVGLFGFPVLFLYAIAWALLPDLEGRIPLQDALRGRFVAAHAGILACLLLGLLPAPLAVFVGAPTWWSFAGAGGVFTALSVLWMLGLVALAGGLLFVVIRGAVAAGRPVSNASAATETAPSTPTIPASETAPRTASAADSDASAAPTDSGTVESAGALAAADDDAPFDEMAAWRAQHAAWKVESEAWRREQQDLARTARDQARRERHAHAAAFTAEAAERRRIRRLTKPRTPFAYVAALVGLAVLVGTLTALAADGMFAVAQGLFWGALVLAAAMVVAGALRWRSGFVAFATMLTLAGGLVATAVPTVLAMHAGSYGISNIGDAQPYPRDAPFRQPWGDLSVYLDDTGSSIPLHIDKGMGTTWITVEPGVELVVEATTTDESELYLSDDDGNTRRLADEARTQNDRLSDGRTRSTAVLAAADAPITTRQTLVITQDVGPIQIRLLPAADADSAGTADALEGENR
ncbi:PspC domain-containing protein [Microbacterium telephonicum]|uniref:Phage shock protein C (PspC) family protein n=1 Tax=Microbacterium telephonicum TaxID=1714841 RepID=A0A498BWP0_9MICO|nr:PspC domain-containing protein [Microbacterium telephonicum]RLK47885.1 phage shock protein C (PspC) family protein [Microbacterium telephonicum]